MEPTYISAWTIHTQGAISSIQAAIESGEQQSSDTVWQGPDGSLVIAADAAELEEEYGEYTDAGLVEEWIG